MRPRSILQGTTSDGHEFPIFQGGAIHDPDENNKVKRVIQQAREDTEIFPHLNNFNAHTQSWDAGMGDVLKDPAKRNQIRQEILRLFTAFPGYHGLSFDIESLNEDARPAYLSLDPGALRRPARAPSAPLRQRAGYHLDRRPENHLRQLRRRGADELRRARSGLAARPHRQPGLVRRQPHPRPQIKVVPIEKLICAVGNYGYDWEMSIPDPKARDPKQRKPRVVDTDEMHHVSDVWQRASDADADLDLDYNSLNPHYEYIDEDTHTRHVVWFLDGVTLLNEMRAARGLGLQTFALWRLGSEDRAMWNMWDKPSNPASLDALGTLQPGPRRGQPRAPATSFALPDLPQTGKRTVTVDTDEPDPRKKLIIDEHMDVFPHTYTVEYYGYHPNEVAISFDDGPDPKWTPRILDILKEKHVKGTFMMIGAEAQENIGLMQRVQREGHEIGNHTFFHPDISEIHTRPARP